MFNFIYVWIVVLYGDLVLLYDDSFFGVGCIWFDDVDCIGNESFLSECGYSGWLVYNCDYVEDVGVWCGDLLRLFNYFVFLVNVNNKFLLFSCKWYCIF